MDTYLKSQIPFVIDVSDTPEHLKRVIYAYIRDNVPHNAPECNDGIEYSHCRLLGVAEDYNEKTFVYFHNVSKYFNSNDAKSLTVFDFDTFYTHMRNAIQTNHTTTNNTNQETTTMNTITQPSLHDRIIENLPTDIYHFRRFKDDKKLNTGGMTVIVKLVGNKLVVGATVCGIDQTFDRKEGIRQASDRFEMIEGTYEKLPTKYEMLEIMKAAKTQNTVRMYRLFSRMVG